MFQLQKCHPSVMNNEIAFTASLGLRCGVGAAVIKALSGAPGPPSSHACVLESGSHMLVRSVFVSVGSQMGFRSKASPANAALSAN